MNAQAFLSGLANFVSAIATFGLLRRRKDAQGNVEPAERWLFRGLAALGIVIAIVIAILIFMTGWGWWNAFKFVFAFYLLTVTVITGIIIAMFGGDDADRFAGAVVAGMFGFVAIIWSLPATVFQLFMFILLFVGSIVVPLGKSKAARIVKLGGITASLLFLVPAFVKRLPDIQTALPPAWSDPTVWMAIVAVFALVYNYPTVAVDTVRKIRAIAAVVAVVSMVSIFAPDSWGWIHGPFDPATTWGFLFWIIAISLALFIEAKKFQVFPKTGGTLAFIAALILGVSFWDYYTQTPADRTAAPQLERSFYRDIANISDKDEVQKAFIILREMAATGYSQESPLGEKIVEKIMERAGDNRLRIKYYQQQINAEFAAFGDEATIQNFGNMTQERWDSLRKAIPDTIVVRIPDLGFPVVIDSTGAIQGAQNLASGAVSGAKNLVGNASQATWWNPRSWFGGKNLFEGTAKFLKSDVRTMNARPIHVNLQRPGDYQEINLQGTETFSIKNVDVNGTEGEDVRVWFVQGGEVYHISLGQFISEDRSGVSDLSFYLEGASSQFTVNLFRY